MKIYEDNFLNKNVNIYVNQQLMLYSIGTWYIFFNI